MMSQRSVMALLAVLALSVKVAQSAIAAPDLCGPTDVGKDFCSNCLTKAKCVTDGIAPEDRGACTVPGEACTVTSSGFAVCTPFAKTACNCSIGSLLCDPYNPDLILFCTNYGPAIKDDCSVTSETCIDGECHDPSSTTLPPLSPDDACTNAPDGSMVLITPHCTTIVHCNNKEPDFIFNCTQGTYYDMDERRCNSLPPVPCAGDCSTGACPDKSDCSKWYVCTDGVVEEEETCDVNFPIFDINTNECVTAGSGDCTGNLECNFDSTAITETTPTTVVSSSDGSSTGDGSSSTGDGSSSTGDGSSSTSDGSSSTGDGSSATTSKTLSTSDSTTTTSRPATCTAANVGKRYPYEGDCKKYWTCYEISNGNYDYVESTCLGDYVFNPDTGYCDLPANVPGCLPTS